MDQHLMVVTIRWPGPLDWTTGLGISTQVCVRSTDIASSPGSPQLGFAWGGREL